MNCCPSAAVINSTAKIMGLQGLNKKEIQVIAQTNRDNYSVRIYSETGGLWQVDIRMKNPDRDFRALTQRGELKTWRDLAGAVSYIQETCPDCNLVSVEVGTWTFSRTS